MLFSEIVDVDFGDFFETMTMAAVIPASNASAVAIAVHRVRARCLRTCSFFGNSGVLISSP